jgi:hypothetical protein
VSRNRGDGVWNPALKCFVVSVSYDFESRCGDLYMGPSSCCDMAGCVNLFIKIDHRVDTIDTYQNVRLDTGYRKVKGEWIAVSPKSHPQGERGE